MENFYGIFLLNKYVNKEGIYYIGVKYEGIFGS